jgi:hypothetical protein
MGGSGHGQACCFGVCLEELSETMKGSQDFQIDGSSAYLLVTYFG